MAQVRTDDQEVEHAANFLCSMSSGNTTLTTKQLKAMLLRFDGRLSSRGHLYDITSKKIGPGVYRVWLEPWKG